MICVEDAGAGAVQLTSQYVSLKRLTHWYHGTRLKSRQSKPKYQAFRKHMLCSFSSLFPCPVFSMGRKSMQTYPSMIESMQTYSETIRALAQFVSDYLPGVCSN